MSMHVPVSLQVSGMAGMWGVGTRVQAWVHPHGL